MNKPTANNSADKYLVDRILCGDAQAFGTMIKNTEGLVAQIVYKLIPNAEDRKDIAQDVYLKAFHKLGSFKFEARLSTWIGQIAYNSCLSWMAKKKLVFPGELDEEAGRSHEVAGKWISQKELSAILRTEIDNLPPVYQMLISLFHQEDQTYEEMAQITGLPVGTVKSYLFRARKLLRESLLSKYKKEAL